MRILITSGMHDHWCDTAQRNWSDMGLEPCDAGGQTGLEINTLIEKMATTYANEINQSHIKISPGKTWEIASADIVLSNSTKQLFGWSNSKNLEFLDFWSEFEPNSRFCLLYGCSSESLGRAFEHNRLTDAEVATHLDKWSNYHQRLLKFFHSNPDRCILAHIDAFEMSQSELVSLFDKKLDVPLQRMEKPHTLRRSHISTIIAEQVVEGYGSHSLLLEELDSAADLPRVKSNIKPIKQALSAVGEFRSILEANREAESQKTEIEKQAEEIVALQEKCRELQQDVLDARSAPSAELLELQSRAKTFELALVDLTESAVRAEDALKSELDEQVQRTRDLQNELSFANDEKSRLQQHADAAKSEASSTFAKNRVLAMQIEQIQDELDHYVDLYVKTKDAVADSSIGDLAQGTAQFEENLMIDLKSIISGDGWYPAEDHGRWAGADTSSNLRIPRLKPQKYQIDIRVSDVMSWDHLESIKIFFDGVELPTQTKILADMGGRLAILRRHFARIRRGTKPAPALVTAIISEDLFKRGQSGHELRFLSANPVRPRDLGGADDRTLSVCYDKMHIFAIL